MKNIFIVSTKYSVKNLQTFMCNGVAARFDDASFWGSIDVLMMTGDDESRESALSPEDVTVIIESTSAHLNIVTARQIRTIKHFAEAAGLQKWRTCVTMPLTTHIDVVASLAASDTNKKRLFKELCRGSYRERNEHIKRLKKRASEHDDG